MPEPTFSRRLLVALIAVVCAAALAAPAQAEPLPFGGFSSFEWSCGAQAAGECISGSDLGQLAGHRFVYRFGAAGRSLDDLRATVAQVRAAGGEAVLVLDGDAQLAQQTVADVPGVAAVQVGNEPNGHHVAAATYARELCATARALAGRVRVISAGLAPHRGFAAYAAAVVRGWRRCGRPALAGFGLHPYAQTPRATLALLATVRGALDRAGARSLPIVASEFGVTSAAHGEAGQASYVVQTLRLLGRERSHLRLAAAWWFGFRDLSQQALAGAAAAGQRVYVRDSSMALSRADGSPKAAWAVWLAGLR